MKRFTAVLPFLPLVVLMATAYVWPVGTVVRGSFIEADGTAGIGNYRQILESYYFRDALFFSLRTSFLSTFIAMALALVMALALRDTFPGKRLALFMSQYNLSVPRLAAAMIMVLLLSPTGFLSSAAYSLGLTDGVAGFPWLVYDAKGIGLVITFVWKFFPYIGLSVLGILQSASRELEEQAATLGVGPWRRFFHVVLPTVIPAVTVSTILVFAASFGDYEAPAILGSAQRRSISVMLYLKYVDPDMKNPPEAFAMMVLSSLVLMVLILGYRWLTAGGARKRGL
ncbi:MAG: ABC transporter permease subunit [Gracilibacteraceae bacterium]|jgi:putative spermidine/putrescine transport system permease protein|nr:ABC transporter permease subunit [Gracilibacteraceae bacterium]